MENPLKWTPIQSLENNAALTSRLVAVGQRTLSFN